MRIRFRQNSRLEHHAWTLEGEKLDAPENVSAIQKIFDEDGPILVRHWYLGGATAPNKVVFESFEEFVAYLEKNAGTGDEIEVWNLWPFMRDTPPVVKAKCPDADGAVPREGFYQNLKA